MTKEILYSILLSLLPISELRGGIPYAYFNDIPLQVAAPLCILSNALVPLIVWLFLASFHKLFSRSKFYKGAFDRFVENARKKVSPKVEKYGYVGLMIFVAIPLPVTGAWTGTLGAWILGMEKKKATLSIMLGVVIAGIIVTAIMLGGKGINSVFIKKI
jgi:uncharacterized membrane protein